MWRNLKSFHTAWRYISLQKETFLREAYVWEQSIIYFVNMEDTDCTPVRASPLQPYPICTAVANNERHQPD